MFKGHALRRLMLLGLIVGHILVPLGLIDLMATAGKQDSSTWLMILIATATYIAYIALAGAWSWFGIYTQKALPLILVVAAYLTRPRYRLVTDAPEAAELRLFALAIGAFFLIRAALAFLGRWTRKKALNLTFPMRDGRFIVQQGG